MIFLSTNKFSTENDVRSSSWSGYIDNNKFALLLGKANEEIEKNSLIVSTELPNKFTEKEIDVCVARYDKPAMFYIASQFNIPIPKYIELTSLRIPRILDVVSEMSSSIKLTNDSLVAIRAKRAARGVGNLIIRVNKILELIFLVRTYKDILGTKKGVERFAVFERFRNAIDLIAEPRKGYGDYRDEEEKYRIESSLLEKSGSMFIQEVITEPMVEFRIYLTQNMEFITPGNFIGVKRVGYGLTEKLIGKFIEAYNKETYNFVIFYTCEDTAESIINRVKMKLGDSIESEMLYKIQKITNLDRLKSILFRFYLSKKDCVLFLDSPSSIYQPTDKTLSTFLKEMKDDLELKTSNKLRIIYTETVNFTVNNGELKC